MVRSLLFHANAELEIMKVTCWFFLCLSKVVTFNFKNLSNRVSIKKEAFRNVALHVSVSYSQVGLQKALILQGEKVIKVAEKKLMFLVLLMFFSFPLK